MNDSGTLEKVLSVIGSIFGVLIFFVAPLMLIASPFFASKPDVCVNEPIPHTTEWVESAAYIQGEEVTTTEGTDGSKEVCRNSNGEVTKETLISNPVNGVISVGTTPENEWGNESLDEVYETQGGAICSDGWVSSSTGRGTCSHHGGVAEWL